jgi:hypothetical protein
MLENMGFPPPHWDGLALFEVESFEKFFAVCTSLTYSPMAQTLIFNEDRYSMMRNTRT